MVGVVGQHLYEDTFCTLRVHSAYARETHQGPLNVADGHMDTTLEDRELPIPFQTHAPTGFPADPRSGGFEVA